MLSWIVHNLPPGLLAGRARCLRHACDRVLDVRMRRVAEVAKAGRQVGRPDEQGVDPGGRGDLAGVTAKIPYLRDLRVGTILLDPIQPTSYRDGNRAVSDFTGVAGELGDEADFDRLVQASHAADLKLVMTLPINQMDAGDRKSTRLNSSHRT